MGEKWLQAILGLCLFSSHFSPMSKTLFFSNHLKWKASSIPLPYIFQYQGSGNSFRAVKAACIGPVLSKFRPSVGDGATKSFPPGVLWVKPVRPSREELVRSQLTSLSLESLLLDSIFFSSLEKPSPILFFAVKRGSSEEPTRENPLDPPPFLQLDSSQTCSFGSPCYYWQFSSWSGLIRCKETLWKCCHYHSSLILCFHFLLTHGSHLKLKDVD